MAKAAESTNGRVRSFRAAGVPHLLQECSDGPTEIRAPRLLRPPKCGKQARCSDARAFNGIGQNTTSRAGPLFGAKRTPRRANSVHAREHRRGRHGHPRLTGNNWGCCQFCFNSPAMASLLGAATFGGTGRPRLQCGYARRNVHAVWRLHAHRLHDNRAVRASDQDVGTRSRADRAAGGCTRIGSPNAARPAWSAQKRPRPAGRRTWHRCRGQAC
jgi:hypothetical protein